MSSKSDKLEVVDRPARYGRLGARFQPIVQPPEHDRFAPILLKKSDRVLGERISWYLAKIALSNISSLAWPPMRKSYTGSFKFELAGLFQQYPPIAAVERCGSGF